MLKMRCPECKSKKVERYDNFGTEEFICDNCRIQWIYVNDNIMIL